MAAYLWILRKIPAFIGTAINQQFKHAFWFYCKVTCRRYANEIPRDRDHQHALGK